MYPSDQKITIKHWAEEDRPREKLISLGRRSLSDAELIAILIGSGSRNESAVELSKRILHASGYDLNQLGQLTVQQLSQFKGIGEAKAISIIAALELGRRRKETEKPEKIHAQSSRDIYHYIQPQFADLNHEEFWIVLLNRSSRILSKHLISRGGQGSTAADPKIIFNIALQHHAAFIVLVHNHPSGSLKPSHSDIDLTRKMKASGQMLDLLVIDHLIISEAGFYSMADNSTF